MKTRGKALCLCLAAAILCALPVDALGAVRQKSVTLSSKLITIDLAKGNTQQLTGAVNPSNASQKMVWYSATKSVATISSAGLITAKKVGTARVGARPSGNKNWAKATIKVIDSLMPSSVKLDVSSLSLSVGSTHQLTATALPSTAAQTFRWASNKSSVASVSSSGLVTAKKVGTALIRAYSTRSSKKYRTIKVTVKKLANPSKITLSSAATQLEKGATLQLTATVSPASANASITWSSSSTSVATVSSGGLVTAKKAGYVYIYARSKAKSSIYARQRLTVTDAQSVTSVDIVSEGTVVRVGSKLALDASVLPASAPQGVSWSSNNTSVATVSSDGTVTGKTDGSATITAKAGDKTDTLRVVVQKSSPVTTEPSQKTSVSGINANLAKIDNIQRYATTELDALYTSGVIDKSEALERKTIILNAFMMARFPWMSSKSIGYYSSNGKSYSANTVYFGIPYTQKTTKRTYTKERLLDAKAFVQTGSNAYYTANIPSTTYPGNDCSSFVSMSQWGLNTNYSYLNSDAIKASTAYKTIASSSNKAGFLNMRPGDVLVKNGHALMFLYYGNSARTTVMIIQQGGFTTLSTVACDFKDLSYYRDGGYGYVARRKTTFD